MTEPVLIVSAWVNISADSLRKQLQKERGAFSFSFDWSNERTGPVHSLQPIRLTTDDRLITVMTTVAGEEFTSRDVIFYTLNDWTPQPSQLTVRCDLVTSYVLDYLQHILTVLLSFDPAVVSRLEYFPGFYPEELPPMVWARYSTWQGWITAHGGRLDELSKRYRPSEDEVEAKTPQRAARQSQKSELETIKKKPERKLRGRYGTDADLTFEQVKAIRKTVRDWQDYGRTITEWYRQHGDPTKFSFNTLKGWLKDTRFDQ